MVVEIDYKLFVIRYGTFELMGRFKSNVMNNKAFRNIYNIFCNL